MTSEADELYNKLATESAERQVEIEGQGDGIGKSLEDKMAETPDLSDLQAALTQLFPGDLGGKVYNALMVARIAPDAFLPLLKLIVNEQIVKSPEDEPISVVGILAVIYTLLSIGLDGKGRIDHIELAGASKDSDDLEKLGGLFGK